MVLADFVATKKTDGSCERVQLRCRPHVSFPGADIGEPVSLTPSMMVGRMAKGRVCRTPEDSRASEALSFMTKAVSSFFSSFNVSPSAT